MATAATVSDAFVADALSRASAAANKFARVVRSLPKNEQVKVAEAMITALVPHLSGGAEKRKRRRRRMGDSGRVAISPAGNIAIGTSKALSFDQALKGYPEFNPSEPRDAGGQWTAGGAAAAVGGAAATAGRAAGSAMREALSTFTLVPSSKTKVGDAIKEWWRRFATPTDSKEHVGAVSELGGRILSTIFVGIIMMVLAHAFISGASSAVGHAVGQALKVLIQ